MFPVGFGPRWYGVPDREYLCIRKSTPFLLQSTTVQYNSPQSLTGPYGREIPAPENGGVDRHLVFKAVKRSENEKDKRLSHARSSLALLSGGNEERLGRKL